MKEKKKGKKRNTQLLCSLEEGQYLKLKKTSTEKGEKEFNRQIIKQGGGGGGEGGFCWSVMRGGGSDVK